ncbi:MAG: 23S rRNA (pseudouridine(1915)-N(3))-methyltransferase RlmH [Thermoanaerobaculia bacterium]
MGLRFEILWAGRNSPEPWESLCRDYCRRIEPWVPIRERPIRVPGKKEGIVRRRIEAEALRAATPGGALTVALTDRGDLWSSERLAQETDRWRAEWPHEVVFYLGSDLGLDPELVASCRLRLAFGRVTLPHQLARLVLVEQLYRALSINAGIHYHRATL